MIATRLPGPAFQKRSGEYIVIPAPALASKNYFSGDEHYLQSSGAALSRGMLSGMLKTKSWSTTIICEYPPAVGVKPAFGSYHARRATDFRHKVNFDKLTLLLYVAT